MLGHVRLCVTVWTVAHQAPLSIGFSRQESCSGLPCPPPGHLPDPGIEPESLMSAALTDRFFTTSATWEALVQNTFIQFSFTSPYFVPTVPASVYLGNNRGCTQGEAVRLHEEEEKDVSSGQRHCK